jgi:hypothetical protein
MQRSRSRSSIDFAWLAALGVCGALSACGGSGPDPVADTTSCGPSGATDTSMVATGTGASFNFGPFTSSINNDCPVSGAPAGVVSVTLFANQTNPAGQVIGKITLCISRPDLLARSAQALVKEQQGTDGVHLVDLDAMASNCSYSIAKDKAILGTASATGLCSNGADPAGFALEVHGTLTLTRTCDIAVDTLDVELGGRVAVNPR